MDSLIRLTDISFAYKGQGENKSIFRNFNFNFAAEMRMGLVGSNGAGKTTLLRLIMGLLKPDAGFVEIFGKIRENEKDFQEARARIGFVFQDADDQLFCPTVEEDIAFGPLNLGLSADEAKERVAEVLSQIGLSGYGSRVTYALSGGEKKLVSLGTALAMRPQMLILDEPTAGLDEKAVDRVKDILLNSGLPYLIVSHDKEFLESTVKSFERLEALS